MLEMFRMLSILKYVHQIAEAAGDGEELRG